MADSASRLSPPINRFGKGEVQRAGASRYEKEEIYRNVFTILEQDKKCKRKNARTKIKLPSSQKLSASNEI